jgi:hypothetical protein
MNNHTGFKLFNLAIIAASVWFYIGSLLLQATL